jgi:tetratricopeptide (TPR) repeat protein
LADETFDVFLSHNSRDKPAVRQIAQALKDRGLRVWLDEWELVPGRRWIPALEKALETTKAAAVMVGESGFGRWEQPEYEGSLSEFVDRGIPVIPVLLPGAPEKPKLPLFLKGFTWVDLREGLTTDGLDRLVWGITGKNPAEEAVRSNGFGPRLHNLPFSPLGDLLKGRDEDLRSLEAGQATAITQAQTIHGLGGIGKTRLAVEHAWRSGDRYGTALFVVADSPEALRSGLASLARPDLLNLPESKAGAEDETLAAVLRWLRGQDRWLLILDNVDTKEAEKAVLEVLPSLSQGRILITSRIRDWPPTVRRQPLETLSLDEAEQFLLERTAEDRAKSEDDPEQARRLAEELGGLPLALEQAAAYIVHYQMSISAYLEDWQRQREEVLNWYDGSVMQYPAPVAVTWQKTFQQLSPTAATILRLTSYLAPDPIPSEMFEEGASIMEEAVGMLCEETGMPPGDSSIKNAIAELASFSMATRDGESFTVHRMVQDALRSRIPEERRRDWIGLSLRAVNSFAPFDADDVRTWPVWDRLRPHAALVVKYADDANIARPTTCLMSQLALLLKTKALYAEAEPLMRRALKISEDSCGPQHTEVAIRLNNLAQLLKATNRLADAEPLMRRVLQIDEHSFGPDHPDIAIDLNNLAVLLRDTNRLVDSEPLMRRALQIDEDSFGPQHPSVARDLNNLAQLFQDTDRLADAEPLIRRALQIDEDSFGPGHPTVAIRLNNLALLLRDTNRLEDAEPLMRRAAEISERSLGPDHPDTKFFRKNLTFLLQEIASRSKPPSSPAGTQG